MQYSDQRVERDWRNSFHARQLTSDTMVGATGIFYGAAATSKVATALPAGANIPHLTISILALSQWVVVMLLFGTLVLRHWYIHSRKKVVWVVPVTLGCSIAYWSSKLPHQDTLGSDITLLSFLRVWCMRGKWLLLSLLAYGIRQPLDKHMTSHFPGVLAALTTNKNVCTEMAVSAEARSAFHVVYRLWRLFVAPSVDSLQHVVYHRDALTTAGFTDVQACTVCQGFFAASQLVLAFAFPCLWLMRMELQDRIVFLQSPNVDARGVQIQFNRFVDVLAVMLLETAFFLTVNQLASIAGFTS